MHQATSQALCPAWPRNTDRGPHTQAGRPEHPSIRAHSKTNKSTQRRCRDEERQKIAAGALWDCEAKCWTLETAAQRSTACAPAACLPCPKSSPAGHLDTEMDASSSKDTSRPHPKVSAPSTQEKMLQKKMGDAPPATLPTQQEVQDALDVLHSVGDMKIGQGVNPEQALADVQNAMEVMKRSGNVPEDVLDAMTATVARWTNSRRVELAKEAALEQMGAALQEMKAARDAALRQQQQLVSPQEADAQRLRQVAVLMARVLIRKLSKQMADAAAAAKKNKQL